MAPIVVDPDVLAGAGRSVAGVGDEFAKAVGTLSASLGGGAPSGLDASGLSFGMGYQKAAQELLHAAGEFVDAARNVGFGISQSASNYSHADAASTIGGGGTPLTAPEKPAKFDAPSCPPSLGGGVTPPFLWSVLENFIPDSWPDGNPGRLKASADAWNTFGTSIGAIAGGLTGPSGIVAGQQIPEGGAMTSKLTVLADSLSGIATGAQDLATRTSDFADDVQSTQDAIRDLCDRVSPSGFFDGVKAIFSGDALDEIKEIADDVQQVLENFGRQVDGKIALMQSLITALDGAVVSLQQSARREFTHYLGDEVGGALASGFEFESNLGEGFIKAGLNAVVGIQQLDPTRFASDYDGAKAAWGGVLETLNYANPSVVAMDPVGAFEHGKDMLGGILHTEDWTSDRPGLGLGGVVFEAASAATGVGAAKTGLRGVSAAADAGEEGAAVRAVAGAADSTLPIAGRASEIAGELDGLTTFADDVPSGASPGASSPSLPPSLTDPTLARVSEAPHVPESPPVHDVPGTTPHSAPEVAAPRPAEVPPQHVPESSAPRAEASPQHVPDTGAPRPAELPPQHVPESSAPRIEASPQHVPDTGAPRVPEPVTSPSGGTVGEGAHSPAVSPHAAEAPSTKPAPEPALVGSGSGPIHTAEAPSSGSTTSPHAVAEVRGPESVSPAGPPEAHSGAQSASAPPDVHGTEGHPGAGHGDSPGPDAEHPPTDSAHHGGDLGDGANGGHHVETLRTDDLHHPQADLLDTSEIDAARDSPTRVAEALADGLPSSDPSVKAILPDDFDKFGGLGEAEWEKQYWPNHDLDSRGNPQLTWPDPDRHPEGFLSPEDRKPGVLEPGSTVDRFGPGFGRFVSPDGTPFPERGLPFQSLDDGYHRYEVVKPLPVWEGPIAPAMGQPGGGIQYYLPYPVVDLLLAGYIREVT